MGTSDPRSPWRFWRGEQPSFKESLVFYGWKVKIASRASVEEKGRKGAAPAVERRKRTVYPDPAVIYT